jgi:enoyl-CoA hydratase
MTENEQSFSCIKTYLPTPQIGVVQINRPDKLNALSLQTMTEIVTAFEQFQADDNVLCIIIHGDDKSFAAGADITEMANASAIDMLGRDQFQKWERIRKIQKPIIAAVSGFALGGGCELTMICDMIVASETAQFGQPEIKIGVMPGAGGTQRLTRAIGKARAMELALTGKMISAQEAFRAGLVTKVVPATVYVEEAISLAKQICKMPPVAVRLAKESVLKSFDTTIETGMEFERKNFYLLFASEDAKEGMTAFVEKRKPKFEGK